MAIQNFSLAVILHKFQDDGEVLLVKQPRQPKYANDEYDSYVDSDLWDLPSTPLNTLEEPSNSQNAIQGAKLCSHEVDLRKYDLESALNRVLVEQVGFEAAQCGEWKFWKHLEEADFGPGWPNHTVFLVGKLVSEYSPIQASCKWMSVQSCHRLLIDVRPNDDRVGPLIALGILNDSIQSEGKKIPPSLHYQEYPPGVILVPLRSRTAKPFHTTNLVVFAPDNNVAADDHNSDQFSASGDALIVDPGCRSKFHNELIKMIVALPKKLIVFVTHHHRDHVDGLSIIQKYNPDATLVAHENTMRCIGKDDWALRYISVSGNEGICIKGHRLNVIFAPGHTDGHMGLLHVRSHSLIVGDHCVGQGSAILDVTSGGNMSDYFQTTYKFMDIAPHVLIPMHGRINLWPKHMLCRYLKKLCKTCSGQILYYRLVKLKEAYFLDWSHCVALFLKSRGKMGHPWGTIKKLAINPIYDLWNRRSRETAILKAIEDGAKSLFEIVSIVYSDVDRKYWIPASSNVRLHVDHLAQQHKLPKEFSMNNFKRSCWLRFACGWMFSYLFGRRTAWAVVGVAALLMFKYMPTYQQSNKRYPQ